jgi:type IV fimbrial biogenesis protein FimT
MLARVTTNHRRPAVPALSPAPVSRGFTLIELLVTFALLAIMLTLAAPSFVTFQRNSELTSTANSLLATISAARVEAMKVGRNAYVVPAANDDWATGWYGFVDLDASGDFSTGDTKFGEQAAMPASVVLATDVVATGFADGTEKYVRFSGAGYPTLKSGGFNGGAIGLTNGSENRRVVVNTVGRMRVCKTEETTCTPTGF